MMRSLKKDLDFLELSIKLSKEKTYSGDIYRIKVFDYDEYFTREVSVLDEEVAELMYDITTNILTVLDKVFHDADELWTEKDEKRFIKKYSKIKQILEKIMGSLTMVKHRAVE